MSASHLKVKKHSHSIRKPSPSSSSSSMSSTSSTTSAGPAHRNRPVIIYASSPKVIHTEPGNFMTLVQKLTGMSSSDAATAAAAVSNEEVSSNNVGQHGAAAAAVRLPPSDDASPVAYSSAGPMVSMGCSDFLDSTLFMEAELMEMMAPPVGERWGWNFGLEDGECLF